MTAVADPALGFWLRHAAAAGGSGNRTGTPRTSFFRSRCGTPTGCRKSCGSPPIPTSRGKTGLHCSPPATPSSPRPPNGSWPPVTPGIWSWLGRTSVPPGHDVLLAGVRDAFPVDHGRIEPGRRACGRAARGYPGRRAASPTSCRPRTGSRRRRNAGWTCRRGVSCPRISSAGCAVRKSTSEPGRDGPEGLMPGHRCRPPAHGRWRYCASSGTHRGGERCLPGRMRSCRRLLRGRYHRDRTSAGYRPVRSQGSAKAAAAQHGVRSRRGGWPR